MFNTVIMYIYPPLLLYMIITKRRMQSSELNHANKAYNKLV